MVLKHNKVTTRLKNKLRQKNIDVMSSSQSLGHLLRNLVSILQ